MLALPAGGPYIQGNRPVDVGEVLTLNCTSLQSKPAAKLTFYINEKKVNN